MAAEDYYDTNVPNNNINVSSTNREFQTSIIIKQDPRKSGILSFLRDLEEVETPLPTRPSPQTIRPSRREGY